MERHTLVQVFRGLRICLPLALLLAACSGSDGSPTDPDFGVAELIVEDQLFQFANQSRVQSGVQELNLREALSEIARNHSKEMRDRGFFGHNGSLGGLRARLRAAGIQFSTAAENLARVSDAPNPAAVAHAFLMDSQVHRDNILNGQFKRVGIGVARLGEEYWITQIFIKP